MDEARIRELQAMIDDGRAECQQAYNNIKRLDAELVVARENASRIEERLLTAMHTYAKACNELEKELHKEEEK